MILIRKGMTYSNSRLQSTATDTTQISGQSDEITLTNDIQNIEVLSETRQSTYYSTPNELNAIRRAHSLSSLNNIQAELNEQCVRHHACASSPNLDLYKFSIDQIRNARDVVSDRISTGSEYLNPYHCLLASDREDRYYLHPYSMLSHTSKRNEYTLQVYSKHNPTYSSSS